MSRCFDYYPCSGGGRRRRGVAGREGWRSVVFLEALLVQSVYKAMISTTLLQKGVRAAHSIRLLHSTRISSMPIQVRTLTRHTQRLDCMSSAFTHDQMHYFRRTVPKINALDASGLQWRP